MVSRISYVHAVLLLVVIAITSNDSHIQLLTLMQREIESVKQATYETKHCEWGSYTSLHAQVNAAHFDWTKMGLNNELEIYQCVLCKCVIKLHYIVCYGWYVDSNNGFFLLINAALLSKLVTAGADENTTLSDQLFVLICKL